MRRLYVVVRGDLPPGLQMAQACHAVREFSREHPDIDVGENLVVLQAKHEGELLRIWLHSEAFEGSAFQEPDLGNEFTAIALDGAARPLVSSLPLAGKAYVKPDARQT